MSETVQQDAQYSEDAEHLDSQIPDSENEKPLAPKPIVAPEKAAQQLKQNSRVSEDSGKADSVENGELPYKTLLGLQSIHPFLRYFQSLADKEHKESANSSTRFRKHKENHLNLWRFCVVCDLIIIGGIWLLILTGLSITVYKTLIL